jgi:hypothetical protein
MSERQRETQEREREREKEGEEKAAWHKRIIILLKGHELQRLVF